MLPLTEFQFHTHAVRIFPTDDGLSFWIVGKDVADALGYATAKDALRQVPEKHKGRQKVPTPSGEQEMLCVDETGLYRIVLRSNKPEAEPFMEWVTAEVLPTIRRTGSYTRNETTSELPSMLTPAQFEAERSYLQERHAQLMATPIVMTPQEYQSLTEKRLRVGKKTYLVTELIDALEAHGLPREVAQEITGHNRNAVRQFAFLARQAKQN